MALSRSVYANFAAFPGSGVADVIYVDASNDNQFLWNGTTYVSYAPEPIGVLLGNKPDAWFAANPTFVLGNGQILLLTDGVGLYVDAYKLGDGKTELQNLVWKGLKNEVTVNTIGAAINGATTATPNDTDLVISVDASVAKKNTWTQIKTFLKTYFDTIYAATSSLANYVTLGTIQTITAQKTFQTSSNTPTIIATHTSGSGEVLQINKSGNGEGIIINKLSGSGAAMSVYGASINLNALTASQIVETDANKNLISAAKNSGYNLALGTTAGTVLEGNSLDGFNIVNLIRQEFTYTSGAQTFTLSNSASAVYAVFVNGQELRQSQYTVVTTTLTIIDTLEASDRVDVIYSNATLGINPSYTKAETDTLLNSKVTSNSAITGATKTKITYDAKGLVTSGADATTADIAASINKNYVTDAQLTVIGNTSGTNTGDVSVTDGTTIDFTLTGQALTAEVKDNSITEAKQLLADNTTNDVSTTKHGYAPKLPNDATKFLDGTGTYSTPAGGGGGSSATSNLFAYYNFI
jgi:hypothetical protein